MTLILQAEHKQQMQQHAAQTYPEECCGLLLGMCLPEADERTVHQVQPLNNTWEPDLDLPESQPQAPQALNRRRRYWIDPKDLLVAQREARDHGWVILGIYHSHPDHPAVPSEFDRALAWPEYSYVILSVHQGTVVDCQSWRLDEQHQFQPEPIQIKENSDS